MGFHDTPPGGVAQHVNGQSLSSRRSCGVTGWKLLAQKARALSLKLKFRPRCCTSHLHNPGLQGQPPTVLRRSPTGADNITSKDQPPRLQQLGPGRGRSAPAYSSEILPNPSRSHRQSKKNTAKWHRQFWGGNERGPQRASVARRRPLALTD